PDVEEENHARSFAAVPGLVLDSVVEQPGSALDRRARIVANAESTVSRNDQREGADQARIDQAAVRRDPGAGTQQPKQNRRRSAVQAAERSVSQRAQCPRTASGVLGHDLAILPEVERAPVRVILHPILLLAGTLRVALNVGDKRRPLLEDLHQLG